MAEVLGDLASLGTEQLLVVKSLEQSGERRPVILDRIEDLLVVQEATHHLQATATPAPPAPAAPPPAPVKAVSPDLMDQMGGLLAKDAARRSGMQSAWPLPDLGQSTPGEGTGSTLAAAFWPDDAAPGSRRRAAKKSRAGQPARATHPVPDGQIVPNGRPARNRTWGRGPLALAGLVVVVLLGAGGFVYMRQASAAPRAARGDLATLLVTSVPGSYNRGPDNQANATLKPGAGWIDSDTRLWTKDQGQQDVSVSLSQFQTPAQATADAKISAALVSTTVGARAGGTGNLAAVVLTKGSYEMVVTAHGPAPATASEANLVASTQFRTLPAA